MKPHIDVTEAELDTVWGYADFGDVSRMDVVKYATLKCASGYITGFTAEQILVKLGLVTKKWRLTKRGKTCLWNWFGAKNH